MLRLVGSAIVRWYVILPGGNAGGAEIVTVEMKLKVLVISVSSRGIFVPKFKLLKKVCRRWHYIAPGL